MKNCWSSAGPCSEMAAGNHHFLLTKSRTDKAVMIQIITARTRPIGYVSFNFVSDMLLSDTYLLTTIKIKSSGKYNTEANNNCFACCRDIENAALILL